MMEPVRLMRREEAARRELGRTRISRAAALGLIAIFLGTIAAVPLVQQAQDLWAYRVGQRESAWPQALDIFDAVPHAVAAAQESRRGAWGRVLDANRVLLDEMRSYQDVQRNQSVFARAVVPATNAMLTTWLGAGGEEVYAGREGWLFYRPDVDYLTGRGFLEAGRLARRAAAGVQPDPRLAILDFKRQLAARGITLIVMPAPVKPMIEPEAFCGDGGEAEEVRQNPSYVQFKAELERAGVLVFDVADTLRQARLRIGRPQYLRADTHWQPQAMELAADRLAGFIGAHVPLPAVTPVAYRREPSEVSRQGDVAAMLRLPRDGLFGPQRVTVHEVLPPGQDAWSPDRSADVLVLGDSFSNIYSLEEMGWGESAGLVEQLSWRLRRPLDCIVRNAASGYAAREMLGRELARGRDRLAGKRLVVWQFAVRELACGDWRLVDMTLGHRPAEQFFVPARGSQRVVTGIVHEVSSVPRPGRTPYREHIMALHLAEIRGQGRNEDDDAVVYLWSMRNNILTPAARLRPGDKVTLRLRPWSDVADEYEGVYRSELQDRELQLQEPCWGEVVKR